MNTMGRPVLVGTTSVETSELMSSMLQEAGIKHEVSQHHKSYSFMFLLVKYEKWLHQVSRERFTLDFVRKDIAGHSYVVSTKFPVRKSTGFLAVY